MTTTAPPLLRADVEALVRRLVARDRYIRRSHARWAAYDLAIQTYLAGVRL